MKITKKTLKTNKGFTLQDLVIAIIILMLFTGTIGGTYIAVYKVQADTKIDSVATLYTVEIMEYIDKIAYEEVRSENLPNLIQTIKTNFNIPSTFQVNIEIIEPNNPQDLVKTVKLTLKYTFSEQERSIVIERLKVKEL